MDYNKGKENQIVIGAKLSTVYVTVGLIYVRLLQNLNINAVRKYYFLNLSATSSPFTNGPSHMAATQISKDVKMHKLHLLNYYM